MWSSILRSQVQTYFPTCLSIFTTMKLIIDMQNTKQSELRRLSSANPQSFDLKFSDYFVTIVKALILFSLPLFSFFFLRKKFDKKGYSDEFNTAYGTLYQSVDPYRKSVYQMNLIFCCRRLIVAFFTVYINSPLILNIYINIYSSLWIIKYYYQKKPMISNSLNRIEILNEIL